MVMIASDMNTRRNNKRGVEVFASLLLVVLTFMVYFQVRSHEFVVYDDRTYVSENPFIRNGFSVESTQWVFSFKDKDKTYWHPVTWLSHLLDIQLFGLNAGAHLVVNIVIHIINVLLLFSILNRCTGHMWRSAFVAALFALHPMNVESVAWVAARKNVLSTMMWMITLVAYIRYTGRPGVKRYTITVVVYTLGLMAKPMLVTLPFVLLLIDFWPLKRIKIDLHKGITTNLLAGCRLILEKIPLLILSAGSVFIAMFSLHRYGDVVASSAVDWNLRIANALVSYIVYIIKLFLPFNLTCFYPFPVKLPLWQATGSFVLLAGISVMVIRSLDKRPYLFFGWFWYLGTLVPAIGIVQAGLWPAVADRFVYIPYIGLFVAISWGTVDFFKHSGLDTKWLATAGSGIVLTIAALSFNQVRFWENSITLFTHAVEVTHNNFLSHYALGYAFEQRDKPLEAIQHYKASLNINPEQTDVQYNLAKVLVSQGQTGEAVVHYQTVLKLDPKDFQAHNNLGNIYVRQGKLDQAVDHYKAAIRIRPDYAKAHKNLGAALVLKGEINAAIKHLNEALRVQPDDKQTRQYLKLAQSLLEKKGEHARPIPMEPQSEKLLQTRTD